MPELPRWNRRRGTDGGLRAIAGGRIDEQRRFVRHNFDRIPSLQPGAADQRRSESGGVAGLPGQDRRSHRRGQPGQRQHRVHQLPQSPCSGHRQDCAEFSGARQLQRPNVSRLPRSRRASCRGRSIRLLDSSTAFTRPRPIRFHPRLTSAFIPRWESNACTSCHMEHDSDGAGAPAPPRNSSCGRQRSRHAGLHDLPRRRHTRIAGRAEHHGGGREDQSSACLPEIIFTMPPKRRC